MAKNAKKIIKKGYIKMRLARFEYIVKDCRLDRFRLQLDLSPIVLTIADILVKTVPNRYLKGAYWSRQKIVRPSGFEDYGRNKSVRES